MPRKAVQSGGKKDQIIGEAMRLFFENGYEGTSVRMIMDAVGGEIGMFYHYFPSKGELFDTVADRFFTDYERRFADMLGRCDSLEDAVDAFLPLYDVAMAQYGQLEGNMHWSIRYALHARTLSSLVPAVAARLEAEGVGGAQPLDILAGQLIYGVSATIHSASFATMEPAEQRACLLEFIKRALAE